MNFADYALGCAGVAAIAISLGFAAVAIRTRLLPGWTAAPARLAEAILAIGLLTLILELLGTIGLLTGPAIVIAAAIVGTAGWVGGRRPSVSGAAPAGPLPSQLQIAIAVGVTALLFAQWSMPTFLSLDRGIYGGDSLWYHMPFAAQFAQSGSITALHFTDPLYLNWFYPQNSELVHAAGITLFGNDFLSPLINLGWLGLALLAAWCIGRPYGAGAISLVGVAILMAADLMFSRQPGNANNDVVGLALLLSSIALLLQRGLGRPLSTPALAAAGLAAGLALGTKLTFVVPVLALTVGVVVVARGARKSTAVWWGVPLLLGGGYWYIRNLVVAGNPLPWQKIGIGPVALPRSEELHGRDPFSVAHYATDSSVIRHFFFPGLNERFGDLWPALLALAALGIVLALWRGGPALRMLAVVALVTTVAYVFTPLSASGQEGAPLGFRLNLRYLAPALAIGLILLAAPSARLPGRERASALAVLGVLLVVLIAGQSPLAALDDGYLAGALLIGLAAASVVAIALLGSRGAPRAAFAAAGAALALLIAGLGWPEQRDYTEQRYALDAPHYPRDEHPGQELAQGLGAAYEWARGERDQRIGLGGTTGAFFQYGLYGPDSSNRVRYVGERGPRGSLKEITDCRRWREALNDGGYRFAVTTPGYDQDNPAHPLSAPFTAWTGSDPAARPVLRRANVTVFELTGPLDPQACR
ncbi:MAG: hypothetical protein ACXWW8_03615 [Solirubrobacterales bacterium]